MNSPPPPPSVCHMSGRCSAAHIEFDGSEHTHVHYIYPIRRMRPIPSCTCHELVKECNICWYDDIVPLTRWAWQGSSSTLRTYGGGGSIYHNTRCSTIRTWGGESRYHCPISNVLLGNFCVSRVISIESVPCYDMANAKEGRYSKPMAHQSSLRLLVTS